MTKNDVPTVEEQLAASKVIHGSALEKLIRENQDFHLLQSEEANDKIRLPPWLRVYWRKHHPDQVYSAKDPTGGYPRILKNIHARMVSHHDSGPNWPATSADEAAPSVLGREAGTDLRISGLQLIPLSESDIRVNFNDTSKIIAAANHSGAQTQFYSSDGGASWAQTSLPKVLGDSFHSDPTVDWTSDGTAWATTIGIKGNTLQLRSYRSNDFGATWKFDATLSGSQTNTDKQIMWVDHSPTSPFKDNIYVIWHNGSPVFVNRRTGASGAWQTPLQVSGAETKGTGIGGDIKTNSFGDVFAFWPDTGSRNLFVAKSTNGGSSFSAPVTIATTFGAYDIGVPSFASRRALIYITGGAYRTTTKDLVFAVWTDLTGTAGCNSQPNEPDTNVSSTCKTRIWLSRSTDGGATWQAPTMINNQASLNDQFNPWLAVDETNGVLVVIYYDTVNDAGRLKTDVWMQTSSDHGATWSAAKKVTSGQTDETVNGADLGNQYGDYNGLSGYAGKFFCCWTDRRSGGREEIWSAPIMT
jgi:hypothetical protein